MHGIATAILTNKKSNKVTNSNSPVDIFNDSKECIVIISNHLVCFLKDNLVSSVVKYSQKYLS